MVTWCLKITEKVSLNIASEASYVYILSEQKLMEKLVENVKLKTFKWDILSDFQTLCITWVVGTSFEIKLDLDGRRIFQLSQLCLRLQWNIFCGKEEAKWK